MNDRRSLGERIGEIREEVTQWASDTPHAGAERYLRQAAQYLDWAARRLRWATEDEGSLARGIAQELELDVWAQRLPQNQPSPEC